MNFERGKLLKSEELYSGRIIDLVVDKIEICGIETVREVVRHPGGVVVLAEVTPDRIPFVRQHRYPINANLLELPAGKVDRGEDPAESAARELEEETGFRARSLQQVYGFYSSPGFCDELLQLYYSDELIQSEQKPETDEILGIEFYSLEEALEMAGSGEIVDGKTILALLWLSRRRNSS